MTPLTVAVVESLRRYITDDDDMSLFHDDAVVALCDFWMQAQHIEAAAYERCARLMETLRADGSLTFAADAIRALAAKGEPAPITSVYTGLTYERMK